jgi:hypothetical protein
VRDLVRAPLPTPVLPWTAAPAPALPAGGLLATDFAPEAVAAWLDRTAGLTAPAPPPDGDLGPNGTGWLIAVNGTAERLLPAAARLVTSGGPLTGAVGFVLGAAANLAVAAPTPVLAAGCGVALPALSLAGFALTWRRRLGRQLATATLIRRIGDVPSGSLVRFEGVVAAGPTVPTLFRGEPAVLFRNRIGGADETRGIDFFVELEAGLRVRVAVRDAFLLDAPERAPSEPACGPVAAVRGDGPPRIRSEILAGRRLWRRLVPPALYESAVGPGTRVEICGVLERAPAPDGEAVPGRGTPLRAVVRARDEVKLLVRRL